MTDRSGTENRNRTMSVGVRVTPGEMRKLQAAAKRRGVSVPSFMRTTALALAPIARKP